MCHTCRGSTSSAVVTGSADAVGVSESNTVSNLHGGNTGAKRLDDSNTLVTEHLVGLEVVLICAAKTRVGGLNEDLIVSKGGRSLVSDNAALGRATEHVVRNAHGWEDFE